MIICLFILILVLCRDVPNPEFNNLVVSADAAIRWSCSDSSDSDTLPAQLEYKIATVLCKSLEHREKMLLVYHSFIYLHIIT